MICVLFAYPGLIYIVGRNLMHSEALQFVGMGMLSPFDTKNLLCWNSVFHCAKSGIGTSGGVNQVLGVLLVYAHRWVTKKKEN